MNFHLEENKIWEELDNISEEERRERLMESMSEEDFNNMFDRIYNKYQTAFERLA